MTRSRSRQKPFKSVTSYSAGGTVTYNSTEYEEMEDELNHVANLGKGWDVGGLLRQYKRTHSGGTPMVIKSRVNPSRTVTTVQFAHKASFGSGDYPSLAETSTSTLNALGATAIARCEPTSPIANLATTLGELRGEGLPKMFGSGLLKEKTRIARNSGNEYLNYQFGWAPLMSDLKSFGTAVKKSDEILRQYRKDSGKPIRRRFTFPVESSSTVTNLGGNLALPTLDTNYYRSGYSAAQMTKTRTRVTEVKRWFSGCFTYHLAVSDNSVNAFARYSQEADKLFGVSLTPEVVWNLTPWSWATDWFFNTGDILHNLSAVLTDGLVMIYGYMMEESSVSDVYVLQGDLYNGLGSTDLVQTFTTTRRKRIPANPFGFGLTNTDLSSRQLAIIAALGLTRT
jgi:hypothetical protein